MVKAPGEPDAFYNKYTSNGWSNTRKVMARSGDFSQEVMIDPMRRSKQDQLWQVMTKVDNAKLTLSRDHYNLAAKNYHAEYACFTPFLRNRDDNRDGRMQAAEMKWYIPSVSESGMLLVGNGRCRYIPGCTGTPPRTTPQHFICQEPLWQVQTFLYTLPTPIFVSWSPAA